MTETRRQVNKTAKAVAQKAEEVADTAMAKAESVKDVAAAKTNEAIGVAAEKAGEAMHAAADKAAEVSVQAQKATQETIDKMPEPMAQFVDRVMAAARQRPIPFAIGAFFALMMVRRLLFGRRS
ncbi:hypothetical protein [Actinocrispum sp. NPDC049592]|uniref:hypothetical protein n=1 Tax=Actinocrispum sp. NPDC049592 TaxID=3154835 RepID=UPI00344A590B